jgi:hypothetical protein
MGNGIGYGGSFGGFGPHGFADVYGKAPENNRLLNLTAPSVCIGTAAMTGPGWGSAEMVLERIVSPLCTMRFSVRIKRVAGDPLLYMQVLADPQAGSVDRIKFNGYIHWPYPITYNIRNVWQPARYLDMRRWMWIAGHEWNLHLPATEEKHEAAVAETDLGGVFGYNRESGETSGMQLVFLPEQVHAVSAGGTYGTEFSLMLKQPAVRVALTTWRDPRGQEVVKQEFIEGLPVAMEKLRTMQFAWPMKDQLSADTRAQIKRLLENETLAPENRQALGEALSAYDEALTKVLAAPVEETLERYSLEIAALMAMGRVEDAMRPLMEQWVKGGGV